MIEDRHELDVEGRVDIGFGHTVIAQYEVVVCGAILAPNPLYVLAQERR